MFLKKYLTVSEAATRAGRMETSIRRAIYDGHLPAVKKGNQWLIKKSDLDHYLKNPPKPGPKPR